MYLITSYEDAEKYIGRKADKNRKIYNGMLKTYFYQSWVPDRQNAVRRTETLIKKRIKMQLKKSRFHVCGNGFVWNIVRSPSYRLRYVAKWGNASSCRK